MGEREIDKDTVTKMYALTVLLLAEFFDMSSRWTMQAVAFIARVATGFID